MKNQASGGRFFQSEYAELAGFDCSRCAIMAQARKAHVLHRRVIFTGRRNWRRVRRWKIIGRNGEIEAKSGADDSAQVNATRRGHGDSKEAFIEVVEISDSSPFAAVLCAGGKTRAVPSGGVDLGVRQLLDNSRAKITFPGKCRAACFESRDDKWRHSCLAI